MPIEFSLAPAKRQTMRSNVPYITTSGTMQGELLAAVTLNALFKFRSQTHTEIDWLQGYESLDTELQQVVRDAELGKWFADKLVKVRRFSGQEMWISTQIEVQQSPETDFAKRMFVHVCQCNIKWTAIKPLPEPDTEQLNLFDLE